MTIFERLSGDFQPRPDYFANPELEAGISLESSRRCIVSCVEKPNALALLNEPRQCYDADEDCGKRRQPTNGARECHSE